MTHLRQAVDSPAERELTRAVQRVRARYGTDLGAFFEKAKDLSVQADSQADNSDEENEPASAEKP